MAFHTPLNEITEVDLQRLIDNEVAEDRTLEYKRELPGTNDDARKELFADVTAFANALGGRLIFGIEEGKEDKKGVPVAVIGVDVSNADETKRNLEESVRESTRPRLVVTVHLVPLASGRHVVVMDIPRSYAAPHMVTFRNSGKFFVRDTASRHQLDVDELRAAFVRSSAVAERMRDFRRERIAKVMGSQTPVALPDGAKLILHVVPFTAFDTGTRYDVRTLDSIAPNELLRMSPIGGGISGHHYNFDGFCAYLGHSQRASEGYAQAFHNGIIEAVDTVILRPYTPEVKNIPSIVFERELVLALPRYLAAQQSMGVDPPFAVMLSLIGMEGYRMAVDNQFFPSNTTIDRDVLDVPERIIEEYDVTQASAPKVMQSIFDVVWNACGYSKSLLYDGDGNWRVKL